MRSVDAAGLSIGDRTPPRIMGVLNVSVESPYEPSVYDDPGEAATYVDRALIEEGADIVDVGLESANRRLEVLSADEELERLAVAVEAIGSVSGEAVFSIETRYASVAEAALDRGFDMVNDICGFADPDMRAVCEEYDVAVVKMASPPDLSRPGALSSVDEIYDALRRGGLTDKTIVDPAFGRWSEEKTLGVDRDTFRRLREFRALDRPILVSINRKNFLRKAVGRSTADALPASLAATAMAVERGARVIRTHDVRETADAARIGALFRRRRLRDPTFGIEELDVTTEREAARHLGAVGGDPDVSDRSVLRTYRLTGLDVEARQRLASAASDTPGAAVTGTDRALLFTTEDGRKRLLDGIRGVDASLTAVFERIGEHRK